MYNLATQCAYCTTNLGDDEDEDLVEYREQIAEIDHEEYADEEEDEEEESENDALDRIKASIIEKFEETTEAISNIQVSKSAMLFNVLSILVLCRMF